MPGPSAGARREDQATFIVHVQYRQHATWQGSITWADENKTLHFRSALELLMLIDSALDKKQPLEPDTEPMEGF